MKRSPDIHYESELLVTIRQQIKTIQTSLLPSYLNDIPTCDCASVDTALTDTEDPTWCPHQDGNRIYEVLGRILPNLKSAVSELTSLIDQLESRAVVSKEKYGQKVTTWLRAATLFDRVLLTPEPVLEQPIASTANSIQHLVPDVLAYIFREILEDHPLTIVRLSQVNQAFRNVALHTPLLWAKIDILQDVNITALHLECSGDVPLDVSWSLPPIFPIDDGATRLSAFMSLMKPHSQRIRKLNALQLYPTYSQLCIDFVHSTNLPFLEMLEIGHSEYGDYEPEPFLTTVPPALTSLSIHNIRQFAHGNAIHSHLVSSSITTLSLTDSGVWSVTRLLLGMPNLRILHIWRSAIGEEVPPCEVVLLAHLQELVIAGAGFLTGFRTPQLQSMKVIDYGYPRFPEDADDAVRDWTWFSLEESLRDNPQLLHLHLSNAFQTRNRWKDTFSLLPSLTHLHIASCDFPGDCLTEAIGQLSLDGQMPCPRLRCLVIEDEQYISSDMIRTALVTRANHKDTPMLEALTITRCLATMIKPDNLNTIRQCVGSLTVRIFMDYDMVEMSGGGLSGSDELDETESYGPAEGEGYEARTNGEEKEFGSEQESIYFNSCSEGSWASGDGMIVQEQLLFEYGSLE